MKPHSLLGVQYRKNKWAGTRRLRPVKCDSSVDVYLALALPASAARFPRLAMRASKFLTV
jgi:hypothetical protein